MARISPSVQRVVYGSPYYLVVDRPVYRGGGGNQGSFGPAAPTIAGLTLAWDFDFGPEMLGPMQAEIFSRGGTDTQAFVHPISGALEIQSISGARRALVFDSAYEAAIKIRNGTTALDAVDSEFTFVIIFHRDEAGVSHNLWDVNAGFNSGDSVDSLNRYRLRLASTNAAQWSRANGSNTSVAALGTPSLLQRNILIGRGSLGGDQVSRGMMNGGTKTSTVVRSVTEATWDIQLLGAQGIWHGGTSGYQTFGGFFKGKIERVFLYSGSAADADFDTIYAWATAYYT